MTTPTSLPSFSAPLPSRQELATATLTEMGLEPTADGDGDLQIIVNGQQLLVRVSDDGPGLLRVFGSWRIADDLPGEDVDRYGAAHQVTATHALVKVNVVKYADQIDEPGHLMVAVDQMVPEGSRYDVLLPEAINAVLSGVGNWHHLLMEHTQQGDGPAATDAEPQA